MTRPRAIVRVALAGSIALAAVACGGATGASASDAAIDIGGGGGDATIDAAIDAAIDATIDAPADALADFTSDAPIAATSVTFATFNAYLVGPLGPLNAARARALPDHLDQLVGDVVCINEIYDEATKQAVIAAAKAQYPYAAEVPTTNATPLTDATDQAGVVPPPYTTAPCVGDDVAKMSALVSCLSDSCSTGAAGDDTATLIDAPSACISAHCVAPVLDLVQPSSTPALADKRCYDCLLTHWADGRSFQSQLTDCVVPGPDTLAFGGNNGAIVLSKLPLAISEYLSAPSVDYRAGALYTQVIVSPTKSVDFYCGRYDDPVGSSLRPYPGQYGGSATDDATAWQNEQVLQLQQLANEVRARPTWLTSPAVVAGEFYAGAAYPSASPPITALNPAAYAILGAAFAQAVSASYAPACTACSANAVTSPPGMPVSAPNTWSSLIFLDELSVSDVTSSTLFATTPVVAYTPPPPSGDDAGVDAYEIPLSPYYGFASTVVVTP